MPSPPSDLTTLLAKLAASGVDFVLVGGLAAVAQGAPVTTFDINIVHDREPNNVDRLLGFLTGVNTRYRGRPGGQPMPASRTALLGPGHSLFMTDLGPLDVLGQIENGLGYPDLVNDSVQIDLHGHTVQVLRLAAIVRNKRNSSHPKDQQALPVLEDALRQLEEDDLASG